ncbi:hypothetical protein FBU59_004414 [Linderina macrospora]|uniref:Uncharacterized protein n=1 Tax=Linderina macrospora TaxID=4868 RepID=A0ACC1J5H7_9FUNG|nr:hypothetical protein FBU59_004414 [Linderina macrospora]
MPPFEASAEEAANFKNGNEDKVEIWENEDGTWSVKFNKGAVILVPKALRFDRLVTAQLPSGWDPKRYGFPQDIIDQVDPTTLHSMVATVEALLRSGITDPYELYKYVHLSEIGNTIGSSLGGAKAVSSVFIDRFTGKDMNNDILQETMVNVVAGWTNMLLLSSAGPIQPVVAACATSLVSIDVAVETIQTGKAKIMFAGGYDDFSAEGSYEFAQLGATNNTVEDLADGRTPKEMSRPCTTTRHGFVEAQGAAVVMLMSASAAIEIGAPIYGIIAMSGTATDKQGRSIPAPGQGLLTAASERPTAFPSPLLDIDYRREQLTESLTVIDAWATRQAAHTEREATWRKAQDAKFDDALFVKERTEFIASETKRQKDDARNTWGNEFWKRDQSIAPIRGALATWDLTVDDIGVSSFHGTSTKANDKNESEVVDKQLRHLGRTPGHAVPAVCQKWLTGHHKGGAGGVMLNGVLQILRTGIVPGNRNADNIDPEFEKFDYLYYPAQSIHTSGIKAGTVTSFGFAQASGELVVVHPDHLYAVLGKDNLEAYTSKVADREKKTYRYWHDSLVGTKPFMRVKDAAPYTEEQEKQVYMDAGARVQYDAVTDSYHY